MLLFWLKNRKKRKEKKEKTRISNKISLNQFSLETKKIHQILISGGVIAYPTESVFGLGCDPSNKQAINKILAIKKRTLEMGLVLLTPSIEIVADWVNINNKQLKTFSSPTPRPTTYIVPASDSAPKWLTVKNTLAIRLSSDPFIKNICGLLGFPIVSTSANLHGEQPCRSADEVQEIMGSQLDYIVFKKTGPFNNPSTIVDLSSGKTIRP